MAWKKSAITNYRTEGNPYKNDGFHAVPLARSYRSNNIPAIGNKCTWQAVWCERTLVCYAVVIASDDALILWHYRIFHFTPFKVQFESQSRMTCTFP